MAKEKQNVEPYWGEKLLESYALATDAGAAGGWDGMMNCKYITKNGRCGLKGSYAYRHGCFGEDMCRCREPMTNADRIRAMSDEELASLLTDYSNNGGWITETGRYVCYERIIERLKQPAEEDDPSHF